LENGIWLIICLRRLRIRLREGVVFKACTLLIQGAVLIRHKFD